MSEAPSGFHEKAGCAFYFESSFSLVNMKKTFPEITLTAGSIEQTQSNLAKADYRSMIAKFTSLNKDLLASSWHRNPLFVTCTHNVAEVVIELLDGSPFHFNERTPWSHTCVEIAAYCIRRLKRCFGLLIYIQAL